MIAKAVSVIVATVLTVIAVKRAFTLMKTLQTAGVRAQTTPRPDHLPKLRQDPVTGVYYPES